MKPASIKLPYQTFVEATGATASQIAGVLHLNVRTVTRWAHEGIPIDVADELPGKFGTHPAVVWGPVWGVAAEWAVVQVELRARRKERVLARARWQRRLYAGEVPGRFAGRPVGWAVGG